jgi:ribosome maturation factor RimP
LDKPIKFDRHVKRRMKWRRISEEEVYLTLKNADRVEESIKGRINAYKSIDHRYIKVTYKEFSGEILVISTVDKA